MKKFIVALLLTVLSMLLTVSVAFGHYEKSDVHDVKLHFSYGANRQVYLSKTGTFENGVQWISSGENMMELNFRMANVASEAEIPTQDPIYAQLRVIAPELIGGELDMVLSVNGKTYQATAEPIAEGSRLYKRFGNGWVYFFPVNAQMEQAQFMLPGGTASWMEGSLRVTGASGVENQLSLDIVTK